MIYKTINNVFVKVNEEDTDTIVIAVLIITKLFVLENKDSFTLRADQPFLFLIHHNNKMEC